MINCVHLLLLYCFQDRCGLVNANGSSPLENMRGLEHYLNDIIRPNPESTDIKGMSNTYFKK